MLIANFKGVSLISRIIRWVTRSQYSHSAFMFDEFAEAAAIDLVKNGMDLGKLTNISAGSMVEAVNDGVMNPGSYNVYHTPGTPIDVFEFEPPLTMAEEKLLIMTLCTKIGEPYAFWLVFRYFVLRWSGANLLSWFCSELVAYVCDMIRRPLFSRTEAFSVPPDWVARSVRLKFKETVSSL